MPLDGYLTVATIDQAVQYLAATYPSICRLITLPEPTHEGRTSRALAIGARQNPDRQGALLIAGVHAREVVNPDMLVSLAQRLCQASATGAGLTFGGRSYSGSTVAALVADLDMFFFPLVNPDGRAYVQAAGGGPMWRKNRAPVPGSGCVGVDVNRNYDFLWSSGLFASPAPCDETFRGTAAFSEPETRNVRWLLDTNPQITVLADVHSYARVILYPWTDDDNQTTDPAMNFRNPAYDGQRGVTGDTLYREYITQTNLNGGATMAGRVRDAIRLVRGTEYVVKPGSQLYPWGVSGTSLDYALSRHIVDASKRNIRSFVLETGTEFQPLYAEALEIISEVSAGLVELCLALRDCVVIAGQIAVLEAEVRDLQAELQSASPDEKPFLTAQIRQRQNEISNLRAQATTIGCP